MRADSLDRNDTHNSKHNRLDMGTKTHPYTCVLCLVLYKPNGLNNKQWGEQLQVSSALFDLCLEPAMGGTNTAAGAITELLQSTLVPVNKHQFVHCIESQAVGAVAPQVCKCTEVPLASGGRGAH